MTSANSTFSQTMLSRALRGAAKAGAMVSRAVIFTDRVELEFADDSDPSLSEGGDKPMREANLLAGFEASDASAPQG